MTSVTQFQKIFASYYRAVVTSSETANLQKVTVTSGSAFPGFMVTGRSYSLPGWRLLFKVDPRRDG